MFFIGKKVFGYLTYLKLTHISQTCLWFVRTFDKNTPRKILIILGIFLYFTKRGIFQDLRVNALGKITCSPSLQK